jgi:hypothetical protein
VCESEPTDMSAQEVVADVKYVTFGGTKYAVPWNYRVTSLPRSTRFTGIAKAFNGTSAPTTGIKELASFNVSGFLADALRDRFCLPGVPVSMSFQLMAKGDDKKTPFIELKKITRRLHAYMVDFVATEQIHDDMRKQLENDIAKLHVSVHHASDEEDYASGYSRKKHRKTVQAQKIDLRLIQPIPPRNYKMPPLPKGHEDIVMIDLLVTILSNVDTNNYFPAPKTPVYIDRMNNDAAETEIIDGKATFVKKEDLDPTTVMSAKMMANPTLAEEYLDMKERANTFANNKVIFSRIIRQMFDLGITFAFHSESAQTDFCFRHSDMTAVMKGALGLWYSESITSVPEAPEPKEEDVAGEQPYRQQMSDYQSDGPFFEWKVRRFLEDQSEGVYLVGTVVGYLPASAEDPAQWRVILDVPGEEPDEEDLYEDELLIAAYAEYDDLSEEPSIADARQWYEQRLKEEASAESFGDEQQTHVPQYVPPTDGHSTANRDAACQWFEKAKQANEEDAIRFCRRSLDLCETDEARTLWTHLETYGPRSEHYANAKRVLDITGHLSHARAGEILGLQSHQTAPLQSNKAAIKKAYIALSLQLHPDKNKASNAEEAFKRMQSAFGVLRFWM